MNSWIINTEDYYFNNLYQNKILRYIGLCSYLIFILFFLIFLILNAKFNKIESLIYAIVYSSCIAVSTIIVLIKTKKKIH